MIVVACELEHIHDVPVEEMLHLLATTPMQGVLANYARTLIHEDKPLACFGVWPMWPGVGRAWSLISPEARKRYPKSLYKAVKQCLVTIEDRDEMRRIEATVRFGHPSAHSWIRHLGFQREGLMRNYGQFGIGDSHLYARIRPWQPE